jgi:cobalt-zinc-cadmium efflux system membrane fusion protein
MKQNNFIIVMTFCVLFLILVVLASCNQSSQRMNNETPDATVVGPGEIRLSPEAATTLHVEPVKLQPDQPELLLPGKITYDDDRYSRISSPVVGRVTDVLVKLGDHVAKGDPLLAVESPEIGTAYADYVKADSDLATAMHALELAKDLYTGKALSRKDLQQAENDAQKAQAEFVRSRERLLNLHVSENELDKPIDQQRIQSTFFLQAPISGTIVERNAVLGQMAGNDPAQTLFTIADLSIVIAVADLAENDVVRVSTGQKVEVIADAYPGVKFPARIFYISDLVDPNSRTLKLRCRVENPQGRLKPEMFVRVILSAKGGGPALPLVPRSSLLHEGDHDFLFVQTGPNRFSRRTVLSEAGAGRMAVIRVGLKPGEEVVTEGGILLENLLANPG